MQQDLIKDIIQLCRRIDETANEVYAKLSKVEKSDKLSKFWAKMSDEEREHVEFWKRAEAMEGISGIPILFDNPEQVFADLEKALSRALKLLANCDED